MRVVHVYATDLRSVSGGGIANYVHDLIRDQAAGGIDTSLVGVTGDPKDPAGKWMTRQEEGRFFGFLPLFYTRKRHLVYTEGVPLTLIFALSLWFNRRKILSQDAVIDVHRLELVLPFLLAKKRAPIVLTIHGIGSNIEFAKTHSFFNKRFVRYLYYKIESFIVKRVDKLIVVDRKGLDYYGAKYPAQIDKIVHIPTFVDTMAFSPREKAPLRVKFGFQADERIVLFAGRFDYAKGLDLLIEAFGLFLKDGPGSRLLLAGDGEERERLHKKVKKSGIGNIEFIGMIERDKLAELMSCADIFVLASLWEGMPLVVLEALACGVPVVSTDVGQVNELVKDGVTGYLVRRRDPEEMKDKIILALAKAKEMKEKCIETAARFSSSIVVRRIEEIYKEVIAKNAYGK